MPQTMINWTEWLKNSRFSYMNEVQKAQTTRWLFDVRDKVLDRANLKSDDVLIDVGSGTGLLAFGAYERNISKVIVSDAFQDCINECARVAEESGINQGIDFLLSRAEDIKLPDGSVDVAVMRSVLVHIMDKSKTINECYRILKSGGRISIFEPIVSTNTKYYELVNPENIPNYDKFKEIEHEIMTDKNNPLTNFSEKDLLESFENAGFKNINIDLGIEQSTYVVSRTMIDPWFNTPPGAGNPTLKEKFMQYVSEEEVNQYIQSLKDDLDGREITVKSYSAYISAEK